MTASVSIDTVSESIYDDIVAGIIRQIGVNTICRHRALQQSVSNENLPFTSLFQESSTRDIFGQEKSKLKGSETSRYFECGNCGRKISGGRFASHINKCLERDRR